MAQARTQKGIRWIWIISGLFVAFLIAAFGMKAIEGMVSYYLTVDEFALDSEAYIGKRLKLAGYVEEGSLEVAGQRYEFSVAHEGHSIRVQYEGFAPDTFSEGVDVIVEGRAESKDFFRADSLMAKCASKYEVGDMPAQYWGNEVSP